MMYWLLWYSPERGRWIKNATRTYNINEAHILLIGWNNHNPDGHHFMMVEIDVDLSTIPAPESK